MLNLFISPTLLSRIIISLLIALFYNFVLTTDHILSFLIFLPLVGSFVIACLPAERKTLIKSIALATSGIVFLYSLSLWINFNQSLAKFQFVESINYWFPWDSTSSTLILLGVDGISLFFILLTTLLIFVCLLSSWDNIHTYLKLGKCNGRFSANDFLL